VLLLIFPAHEEARAAQLQKLIRVNVGKLEKNTMESAGQPLSMQQYKMLVHVSVTAKRTEINKRDMATKPLDCSFQILFSLFPYFYKFFFYFIRLPFSCQRNKRN